MQLSALSPAKGGDFTPHAQAKHAQIRLLIRSGQAREAMREAMAFLVECEARRLPLESMKCLQATPFLPRFFIVF